MTRFLVVAGTDTGVGKTFVAAALARAFAASGRCAVAIKPIESGCSEGRPEAEDGAVLARATGQARPRQALIRLRAPVTPALAAEREGIDVDVDRSIADIRALAADADVTLVEGAGGVLSPLSWTHDITDVARALDAQVLLVGSDRLGAIHQVHATVHVLADAGLMPAAIVLSAPATPDASTGTNAAALRRRLARFGDVADRIVVVPRTRDDAIATRSLADVAGWLTGPNRAPRESSR